MVRMSIYRCVNSANKLRLEYWLQQYEPRSYVLILDFRDTFFQVDPMAEHPPFLERVPRYDLRVFAENFKVTGTESLHFDIIFID